MIPIKERQNNILCAPYNSQNVTTILYLYAKNKYLLNKKNNHF